MPLIFFVQQLLWVQQCERQKYIPVQAKYEQGEGIQIFKNS